jgi:hypothetical protein
MRLLETENNKVKVWMKQNSIDIFASYCWIWSSDRMWKERSWPNLRYLTGISLEGMGQTTTNLKWG